VVDGISIWRPASVVPSLSLSAEISRAFTPGAMSCHAVAQAKAGLAASVTMRSGASLSIGDPDT
jgi:hypothetical protein